MFCPLCQTEFQGGAAECSECHLPLVATLEEAAANRMELWSGEDHQRMDHLLTALDSAGIPSHYQERMLTSTPGRDYSIVRPRLELAVFVLVQDAEPAEQILLQLERAEQDDDFCGEEGQGR